jgi:hypothetical protein
MAYNLKKEYGASTSTSFKMTNLPVSLKKKIMKEVEDDEFDSVTAFFRTLARRYFKQKEEDKLGKRG